MWDVIDLLKKEIYESNEKGTEFDLAKSINAQMPFFTCRNHLYSKEIQKDIQRYIYCKELGISPYKGSYGEQPAKWIDSFFCIKSAFAKKESYEIEKQKKKI